MHKWTSLVCTLFLLVLSLTGLPLVFRDELSVWPDGGLQPPEHVVATTLANLQALVNDAQARQLKETVQFLILDDEHPAWFVSLADTPTSVENTEIYIYKGELEVWVHRDRQSPDRD